MARARRADTRRDPGPRDSRCPRRAGRCTLLNDHEGLSPMHNRFTTSALAVVIGVSLGIAAEPTKAQSRQSRPSSRISAFDTDAAAQPTAPPAAKPDPTPVPTPTAPAPHVLYGAVIPAAPRVD